MSSCVVDWYIEKRVLLMLWPRVITWEIVQQANEALGYFVSQGLPPVHIVADARFVNRLPEHALRYRKNMDYFDPHLTGWMLTISNETPLDFIGSMFPHSIAESRFRSFYEVPKAIKFLERQDKSLDWDQANRLLMGLCHQPELIQ